MITFATSEGLSEARRQKLAPQHIYNQPENMTKETLLTAVIISLITATGPVCHTTAQDFTISGEYAKQSKRHPGITPYVPDVSEVEARLGVAYETTESGRTLKMDIYSPTKKGGDMTPIVLIHGGGWQSGRRNLDAPLAARLAEGGLCAFCVDYRLSVEAKYPAAIVDINSALTWIGEHSEDLGVDISRLTVAGTSAGGQMAALVGASNGRVEKYIPKNKVVPRIACVVDIDGVLAFIHPDSSEGQDKPGKPSCATKWLGTPMSADSALWREASALSHIGEWSADRFIFINSSQKRFSAGQAEAVEALRKAGKKATEHKTEGTPHTFWLFEPWAEDVAELIIKEIEEN